MFGLYEIVNASGFLGKQPCGHRLGSPIRVFARLARVGEIVDIGIKAHTGSISKTQGKQTREIAVLAAIACLYVANPSDGILFLEIHIQHIVVPTAHCPLGYIHLVIYLDGLDHICRQVLQHYLVLPFEEILSVEQKRINTTAVYGYLTVIT